MNLISLYNQIDALAKATGQDYSAALTSISNLQLAVSALQSSGGGGGSVDLSVVNSEISSLQASVSSLQQAMSSADSNISSLQTTTAGEQTNITTLQNSVSSINAHLSSLDASITTLNSEVAAVVPAAQLGVANGIATLDANAKVPAAQLPSYVDDVIEGATYSAFPATGEAGKIYVALDTNKTYRWTGTLYIEISPSPGSTDSVAEGSVNLYFTAARAQAAITSIAGNAGTATKLATARAIALTGDVTGTANFDGSAGISIAAVLSNTGVTSGTYGDAVTHPVVTVDAKGRVTSVTAQAIRAASTSQTGLVQLSDSVSTASSTVAATSTAVKTVNDSLTSLQSTVSSNSAAIAQLQANSSGSSSGSGISPSVIVLFDGTVATPTIKYQHNVASITRLATGKYRITFTTPMANTNYCVTGSPTGSGMTDANGILRPLGGGLTVNYVDVVTGPGGTTSLSNYDTISCVIHGGQGV